MRRQTFYFILILILFESTAHAQIGSWQGVQNLYPGPIFVEAGHRVPVRCIFRHATDTTLYCERTYRTPFSEPDQITFDRNEIHRIGYRYYRAGNAVKGGLIGAGIGAALGASANPERSGYTRGGSAFMGGVLGGTIGWALGKRIPSVQYKIIYEK